jgi:glycosyltransferase involved in cell wall biosynthesis
VAEILFYIFLACALIQGVYIVFFYFKLAFGKLKNNQFSGYIPISIIVASNNEKENLLKLIPKLLDQNYTDFELIIVDDRSYDDTFDALRELYGNNPKVHILRIEEVHDHTSAKKFALTMGIKAAKNERILFIDADCWPLSSNWLREIAEACSKDTQFVLGYSQYEKEDGFLNLFIRFETLVTAIQYLSFAAQKLPYMGVGRNLSYTKSTFLSAKGFHPYNKLIGGDDDLFVNLHATGANTQIAVIPDAQTRSIPKKTLDEYIHQKKRHLSIGKRYRFSTKLWLSTWHISQIGFWWMFLPVVFMYPNPVLVLAIAGTRLALLLLAYGYIIRKLKDQIPLYFLPVLDLTYTFYYFAIGLVSLRAKNVQWKK